MHAGEVNYEFKFDDTSVSSDLFIIDRSFNKTDLGLIRAWISVSESHVFNRARYKNSKRNNVETRVSGMLPGYTEVTLVPQDTNGSLALLGNGWLQIKINNASIAMPKTKVRGGVERAKSLIAEVNNISFFEKKPDNQNAWLRYRNNSGELSKSVYGMVILEELELINKGAGIINIILKIKLNAVTVKMFSGKDYIFSGQFRVEGKSKTNN